MNAWAAVSALVGLLLGGLGVWLFGRKTSPVVPPQGQVPEVDDQTHRALLADLARADQARVDVQTQTAVEAAKLGQVQTPDEAAAALNEAFKDGTP